jgi:hypothetical protein
MILINNGEQVPEVGRDNLLDPGEAGPEVNHLLEAGHFIFHTLIEIVDKLQKNKREKSEARERTSLKSRSFMCCRPQEEARKVEREDQRGLNSKRGPRSFHSLPLWF